MAGFGLLLGGGGPVGIAWENAVLAGLVEDMAAIEASGVRVHTILGSERLDALGLNLMDYSKRPNAFECGLADGEDHAAAVVLPLD